MYWFLDKSAQDADNTAVLYVGKAKNLRSRLSSYTNTPQLSPRIAQMTGRATHVRWLPLGSEIEALLTEAQLIQRYQPPFNVLLKDDKTPLYIAITDEPYPRVLQVRKKKGSATIGASGAASDGARSSAQAGAHYIGPFASAHKVREVLKLVRPIFGWCNKRRSAAAGAQNMHAKAQSKVRAKQVPNSRPCFYYQLDQCPGVCCDPPTIAPGAYQQNIKQLITFLRGNTHSVTKQFTLEMHKHAAAHEFEQAKRLRDRIHLIKELTSEHKRLKPVLSTPALAGAIAQDGRTYLQELLHTHIGTPKQYSLDRIEGWDVSNIQGKHAAVALVVFEQGRAATDQYRLFNIKSLDTPNDYGMLREAIARRQQHSEWPEAQLTVIDGGKGQVRAALSVWTGGAPVIGIAKDPDRLIIPKINIAALKDTTVTSNSPLAWEVLALPQNNPARILLAQIRDEAHRFSKKQYHRRHLQKLLP